MNIDMTTIKVMKSAGIAFVGFLRVPGGGQNITLEPKDITAFIEDSDQFAAISMGVSKSQYLDWVSSDGTPQCGAKTNKGTRCKNFVSGGVQHSIDDWLRLDGDYCAIHGGEGSNEAKSKRWGSK